MSESDEANRAELPSIPRPPSSFPTKEDADLFYNAYPRGKRLVEAEEDLMDGEYSIDEFKLPEPTSETVPTTETSNLTVGYSIEMAIALTATVQVAPDPHPDNQDRPFLSPLLPCREVIDFLRRLPDRAVNYHGTYGEEDSLHINVPGMNPEFKAWRCAAAPVVKLDNMEPEKYRIARGHHSWTEPVDPTGSEGYLWAGCKVTSPVMDGRNMSADLALQQVCNQLRNKLRIHVPTPSIPTSVHVHIGHEDGWHLRYIQKLLTLWVFIEEPLSRLHRRDRALDPRCAPLRYSRLGMTIRKQMVTNQDMFDWSTTAHQAGIEACEVTRSILESWVPWNNIRDSFAKEFIRAIWQYNDINELCRAMETGSDDIQCAIGLPIFKEGAEGQCDGKMNSAVQFRGMQGTLDGVHILVWKDVCARLVSIARDYPRWHFKSLLWRIPLIEPSDTAKIALNILETIKMPAAAMGWWKEELSTRERDGYFAYPWDKEGIIKWDQIFWSRAPEEVTGQELAGEETVPERALSTMTIH